MYRTRQYYSINNIYIQGALVLSLSIVACSKKNGIELAANLGSPTGATESQLPEPTKTPEASTPIIRSKCLDGEKAVEECLVDTKPSYTYTSEFNGRIEEGFDLDGANGSLSVSIPRGYYESATIRIHDLDLLAANLVAGISIFGITGDLDSSAISDCSSAMIDSGTPLAQSCRFVTANRYAYQELYGGRNQACTINESTTTGAKVTGRCWFDATLGTHYIYDRQVFYPQCSLNTQSTSSCKALNGKFLYTKSYGGRSVICPTNLIIDYKCYVDTPNMTVYRISTCNENPAVDSGRNNYACFPSKIGNWVYDSPFGGRDKNCADDNNGNCYFQFSTKAQSSGNLPSDPAVTTSDNVKVNEVLFGITGTYTTEGFYWGSGAHRDPGDKRMVYQKPPGPTPTVLPYIAVETNVSPTASAPTNYRFVPKITTDTEVADPSQKVVRTKADSSPWGDTPCGQLNGNLDVRIADCASVMGVNATWDGRLRGNAGQGEWKLVARKNMGVGENYEVWLDNSTGLLWSSRVSSATGLNWCKAAGSSFSNKIDEKMREDDSSGICNSTLYQNTGDHHPISACAEGFAGYLSSDVDVANGFISTGTNQSGKAGLKTVAPANKATGRTFWRLPTIYDYMLANHNGLRYVLPDASSGEEWTATTYSGSRNKAWSILISNGYRRVQPKTSGYSVRCVGR